VLTKDECTGLKYKIKFKNFVGQQEITNAIAKYEWTMVTVPWSANATAVEAWCKSYCSDMYFTHTIDNTEIQWGKGPTRLRNMVFINTNDALRFKLSGFGVEE